MLGSSLRYSSALLIRRVTVCTGNQGWMDAIVCIDYFTNLYTKYVRSYVFVRQTTYQFMLYYNI
jgi:hypothetical protein